MTLVRATTTFHGADNLSVAEGSILNDKDPAVRKYPQFFVGVDAAAVRSVEDVTARPGERRGRRARKKTEPVAEREPAVPAGDGPGDDAGGES